MLVALSGRVPLNRTMRPFKTGWPCGRRAPGRVRRFGDLVWLFCGLLFLTSSSLAGVPENSPTQLLLALDTSGSMKKNDPRRLLPKAATLMMNLLEDDDWFGLLRFDESPSLMLEPGPLTPARRRRCLKALVRLSPRGPYTDIPAVLTAALQAFGPPMSSPRALVLITDGQMDLDPGKGDSQSSVTRLHQEIMPALKQANIAIFTVAFTPNSDQKLLRELAAGTQGSFLLVEKASGLHQAFVRIYEKLKQPQLAPITDNRFLIDEGVEEAVLIATRESPDRPVNLTDPLGRKITPKDAPRQVRWFPSPAFDMVTIPGPRPGEWNLSDFKEGEGKVALLTDLKLICPHVPEEVGSDEELVVGAAIFEDGRPVTHAELLRQTAFHAILTPAGGEPYRIELSHPPADLREFWPPGTRVGKFPPLGSPGTACLKVQVQSKTFQRERNFSLRVASPWYREEVSKEHGPGPRRLEFLPGEKGLPDYLHGWVSVQPATGGLAATLFHPAADGAFSLALPAQGFSPLVVDLRLAGVAPSGRPLVIRPAFRLEPAALSGRAGLSDRGLKVGIASPFRQVCSFWQKLTGSLKSKIWWLAGLAALLSVLSIGVLLVRQRWRLALLSRLTAPFLSGGDFLREEKLMLLARVETLLHEKAALESRLKEMEKRLRQAAAENANLLKQMDQQSLNFREKARVIGELEQKLQEAEQEAKEVQKEYMALYARSQGEKKALKEG